MLEQELLLLSALPYYAAYGIKRGRFWQITHTYTKTVRWVPVGPQGPGLRSGVYGGLTQGTP